MKKSPRSAFIDAAGQAGLLNPAPRPLLHQFGDFCADRTSLQIVWGILWRICALGIAGVTCWFFVAALLALL